MNEYRRELSSDEKLTLLFSYAEKIAQESRLENLLLLMADLGRQLVVADRCSLWLYDRKNKELWTRVAHDLPSTCIPADSGIVGHVIQSKKEYFSNDPYNDPYFNSEVDKESGYVTKALLALPLFDNDGNIFGAYQAINKMTEDGMFTESDFNTLRMVASYSEKSLTNAILNDEIERTQKEIIFMMAEVGETRSQETGNHVKRVAEISALLGRLHGLDVEDINLLKMASPMHDIGKVGIPDSILLKPGKLTKEEFDLMKDHASLGYKVLQNSEKRIVKAASTIAHEHHEKWDGTGYPRGLAGEDIHIYARISAIADVFDALASKRVYKDSWTYDAILELFEEEKGTHFDPELAQLFLDNFDKFIGIYEKYKD